MTDDILHDYAVLTPDENARALARVLSLREHWTPRQTLPFFTLGAAAYLDARNGGFATYQEAAARTNPVLAEHFGWLHDRLCAIVSSRTGEPAECDTRLALPGFHVFLNAPLFKDAPASMHYDLQYELLDWTSIGEPDTSTQLSLTLSLALPSGSGGLLVWNINRLEVAKMTPEERRVHSAESRVADYKPYTVGHLAVHSGHQLHQIAPAREGEPEDMRVTMQAHALRVGSRWIVYW
ncbi:MAG: hypothetical protein O3C21_02915 [Verrucomicrobia bacterium]|nr:hypothetical protein [Verrucomicrobiota bacterium]